MKARTEEEMRTRAPLTVKFGDKDYQIQLLPILAARDWRAILHHALVPILESFNFQVDGKAMANGLTAALLQFPEKLTELIFAYAPDLPKDEILATATEEQIAAAFSAIMAVAFPFLPQLGLMRQILAAEPTGALGLAKYTN